MFSGCRIRPHGVRGGEDVRSGMRTLLLMLALLTPVAAAEPELPPEATAVVDRYVSDGAKVVQDADVKRTAARTKLVQALDQVQAAEGKAGRLESALAVKKLRDAVGGEGPAELPKVVDPQLPKGVTRPLESYQADLAKIDKDQAAKLTSVRDQAIKELEPVKFAQTKAGHLDVALAVKKMQEQLRSGQPAKKSQISRAFVFAADSALLPFDEALLRRGGAESTIEFIVTAVEKDGLLFRCGAGGNGQSAALSGDELWWAAAGGMRRNQVVKAPLGGAKPPLHLAVTFKRGEVALWVNGTLAKRESTGMDELGDNGAGGGIGGPSGPTNSPEMPRASFQGELAAFRYIDKAIYDAPFAPAYPLPAVEGVRLAIDAAAIEPGAVRELGTGAQRLRAAGTLTVIAK